MNEVSLERMEISLGKYNKNIFISHFYCLTCLMTYTKEAWIFRKHRQLIKVQSMNAKGMGV